MTSAVRGSTDPRLSGTGRALPGVTTAMDTPLPVDRPLLRLWGVYHADGGFVGEVAYVVGKLLGTAHCALCDITHGVRMKAEWKDFAGTLDVPFELVHLNEQPDALQQVTGGHTPCVVAESSEGFAIVLGPDELEAAGSSVARFGELLREALGR